MAIKAGQFIHDANGFVIDRIQSGGVSNLNIPEEKIYELGNYNTVATVRDIPDLSFELESFDMSCEFEALVHGVDAAAIPANHEFTFATTYPTDIISPFKAGNGAFNIVTGIAVPYLTLENVTYRFGVRQNAAQTFTLRGDSIYYLPGSPYYQEFTLVNNTLTYNLTNTALAYAEAGNTLYVLSACVKNVSTGLYKRLFFDTTASDGYTNTTTSISTITDWFDLGYTKLHVVYGSATAATYNASIHPSASVKPAAVRSKDIDLYITSNGATPTLERWRGVQSFEISRRVNLENDEEFGNTHYVSQDYDVPEVTGSVVLKSADATDLWDKIATIANVASNVVVGAHSAVGLQVRLVVNHPDTGVALKSFQLDDARFTLPAVQGRIQTKLETTFNFTSDSGALSVFNGTAS